MKYIYILIISSLLISCSTNNSLKSIDAVGDHVYEHMTNADNISYNEYLSSFISPEEILEFIGECKYKEYIQEESADIKEWNLASGLDEDVYNKSITTIFIINFIIVTHFNYFINHFIKLINSKTII